MLRSYIFTKSLSKFRINYSTTPISNNNSIKTNATTTNTEHSTNNNNDNNNINPPSFFHDTNDLPKKIDQEERKEILPEIHFSKEINQVSNIATPPKSLFSNSSIPLPHPHVHSNSQQNQGSSLPLTNIGNNDEINNTNTNINHNDYDKSTPSNDTSNYFKSYKDFCMGIAYLGVGTCVIFFIFDQYERLDVSERQMQMMKKKQKELVSQMQTYKTKLNKIAAENAKKNVILQGKMQMHIALLREQLLEAGIDPVTISNAIDKFEEEVKIDVAGNKVELWVPGESKLKSLIPDPHEYNKKK